MVESRLPACFHQPMRRLMSIESRVVTLRSKHADLERVLDHEQHRPAPDSQMIKKMKVEKLRLKEEIARLSLH
jgi:hypothetical protein